MTVETFPPLTLEGFFFGRNVALELAAEGAVRHLTQPCPGGSQTRLESCGCPWELWGSWRSRDASCRPQAPRPHRSGRQLLTSILNDVLKNLPLRGNGGNSIPPACFELSHPSAGKGAES